VIFDLTQLDGVLHDQLLTAFPAAARRIGAWPEHALHLAGASAGLDRRLDRLRISRFLPLHRTLDEALQAARHERRATYRELALSPEAHSPALARRYLAQLPSVGPQPWHEDAEVVVSELISNAVRHARAPITLALAQRTDELLIGVTDPSRQEPVLRPVRFDAAGGRGIQLVDILSTSWGVRLIHQGGKTVWARMAGPAPRRVAS